MKDVCSAIFLKSMAQRCVTTLDLLPIVHKWLVVRH